MLIAQAANSIPDTNSITTALGITPSELFWAFAIIAVMVIGFWAIVKYNSESNTSGQTGLAGSKGGSTKKTSSEYEEDLEEKV